MSDFKWNSLAVLLAIALALACLLLYVEHEHLETVCRLTGNHERIFGEDVKTARQAIDSICTSMPFEPEQPDYN